MGIRVDRAILFGSHARGEAKDGSDIDVLIVSSDFEALNTRERMEQLGTAAAGSGSLSRPLPVRLLNWCMWNPPHFWKKSYRQECKSLNGGAMWSNRWRDSRDAEMFEQAMGLLG
jgi:hypothetical protein